MHSLILMPGTHPCRRGWWKTGPGCRRLRGIVMQGAAESRLNKPPEQAQYAPYYNKDALPMQLTVFSLTCPLTWKSFLFIIPSLSLSLSVLQLVTEQILAMSRSWGYWCQLRSSLPSSWMNRSPQASCSLVVGPTFSLQAVWCSCLSLSVCLLFWHLCVVKDRHTGIGNQCQGTKRSLMACHKDFKKTFETTLYFKGLRV